MENKVMFERLIAGAILKFGKVDSADISLIFRDIDKIFEVDIDRENTDKYFLIGNGNIVLNDNYLNNVYRSINCSKLEKLSVNMIERYFSKMDIEMFVLRKIKLLGVGCVLRDDLIHNFSVIQLHGLWNLYKNGYVEDYLYKDVIYGDYQAVKISKSGMIKLFVDENYVLVRRFYRTLINLKEDVSLLEDYLMSVELEGDILEILDVDNYLKFCKDVDASLVGDTRNNNYSRKLVNGCQQLLFLEFIFGIIQLDGECKYE